MTRPIIGITLDAEPPGGYSKFPWLALRENYAGAVAEAGGVAVLLPHAAEHLEDYLALVAGLVISGGAFDIDPALFGAPDRHATVQTKDRRTGFELALTKAALARDLPVLGICGGQQLLHVALGGTLIQHIPDAVPDALPHEQPNPRDEPGHEVAVVPGSLLARVTGGAARLAVNSSHHQAVDFAGPGVVVSGTAPDGVVEAIEHPGYRFCLGVQWHPEYAVDPRDPDIFRAFVAACREAARQRAGLRPAERVTA